MCAVLTLTLSTLSAGPKLSPFPAGTVLYQANGATITSLSPIQKDESGKQDQIKFTFKGEWKFNPHLKGVHVTPEAGVSIRADTEQRKRELIAIRSMLAAGRDSTFDIYVLSGAVNKGGVTYSWPECVKIEPARKAEPDSPANAAEPQR
jgi:hypothetical protein